MFDKLARGAAKTFMPDPSRRGFLAASMGVVVAAQFASAETPSELCALTLQQAAAGIRAKKLSPVDLTEACLDSIKTWNPKTNAWITVMREKALAQARILPEEQAVGRLRSPLHGIPVGIKDSIDTAGTLTTIQLSVHNAIMTTRSGKLGQRLTASRRRKSAKPDFLNRSDY